MLGIALQRGRLQYMLEWIDMALNCCTNGERDISISKKVLLTAVATMRRMNTEEVDVDWQSSEDDRMDIYSMAVFLMNEV